MTYTGWMIPDDERDWLLSLYPPSHERVYASHVTLDHTELSDMDIPTDADVKIVGYLLTELVEVLIVTVNGTSTRPDGNTYHITMSVIEGIKPAASNEQIEIFRDQIVSVDVLSIQTRGFVRKGEGFPYITTPLTGF